MKRLWICSAILVFILSSAIGWAFFLKHSCEKLDSLIDQAQYLTEIKSDKAEQAVEELCSYWESFASAAALFESSDSLSGISDAASKLEYLYKKDNDEFFSECEVMRAGAERIYRSGLPLLPNKK